MLSRCARRRCLSKDFYILFFIQDKKRRGSTAECLEIVEFVEQQTPETPLLLTSLYGRNPHWQDGVASQCNQVEIDQGVYKCSLCVFLFLTLSSSLLLGRSAEFTSGSNRKEEEEERDWRIVHKIKK